MQVCGGPSGCVTYLRPSLGPWVYSGLKKDGVKVSTFMNLYGELLKLIVDPGDLHTIQSHAEDLAPCKSAVCRMTNATLAGAAMMAEKLTMLEARDFSGKVDKIAEELRKLDKISAADFQKSLQRCHDEAQSLGLSSKELREGKVQVRFLGTTLEMKPGDLQQEALWKLMAVCEERPWSCEDGLPPLLYEAWIVTPKPEQKCPVDSALLKEGKEARSLCKDLLSGSDIASFAHMQAILAKQDVLCSLDLSFDLELCWLRMAGESLENRSSPRHFPHYRQSPATGPICKLALAWMS